MRSPSFVRSQVIKARGYSILIFGLTLIYPLAIFWGQGKFEPRELALLLLLLVALRVLTIKLSASMRWLVLAALLLVALAMWKNLLLPLKLYPVLVNAGLLALFTYSLRFPPSIAERFARLQEPDLPTIAIQYTRRVTQVWCLFFILNGSISLALALWAPDALWSLYTGGIAYLLMGVLFAAEYWVRLRFKRTHNV